MAYAENTKVPIPRSKAEVEALLRKAGASGYMSGWDDDSGVARIQCFLDARMLRFDVITPSADEFAVTAAGRTRPPGQRNAEVEKEERRRWRALVLIVKAKLECIEAGLSTIDQEFLANVVLPDGSTVGTKILPVVERAYSSGKMPRRLLPGE